MIGRVFWGVVLAVALLASEARAWYITLEVEPKVICCSGKFKLTAKLHPPMESIDVEFYTVGSTKPFATVHSDANGIATTELDPFNPPPNAIVTVPGKITFRAHAVQYDYGWSNKGGRLSSSTRTTIPATRIILMTTRLSTSRITKLTGAGTMRTRPLSCGSG